MKVRFLFLRLHQLPAWTSPEANPQYNNFTCPRSFAVGKCIGLLTEPEAILLLFNTAVSDRIFGWRLPMSITFPRRLSLRLDQSSFAIIDVEHQLQKCRIITGCFVMLFKPISVK